MDKTAAAEKAVQAVRLLIADDHPIFRHGVRRLLESEPGFQVLGEAADGVEAVKMVRQLRPDVLLLDLAMPRQTGLDALRGLAAGGHATRTILLTVAIEKTQIVEALQVGARGVVLKDAAPELLLKCIRAVMAGEYWVGRETVPDLAQYLRGLMPRGRPASTYGLTKRELEVVAAVVAGNTNRDIAQKFSLSEDTVKHHLTSIYNKLGVSSRLELAIFAMNHNLAGEP